jgi:hydroxypyruvate isomerase
VRVAQERDFSPDSTASSNDGVVVQRRDYEPEPEPVVQPPRRHYARPYTYLSDQLSHELAEAMDTMLSVANPTPDDEVLARTHYARSVICLPTSMTEFMQSNTPIFLQVLGHQVQLIQRRPQDFSFARVTVYDKVLLNLTRDGRDLDHTAAVVYFVQEFLGIDLNQGTAEVTRALSEAVDARALAIQYQIQHQQETQGKLLSCTLLLSPHKEMHAKY